MPTKVQSRLTTQSGEPSTLHFNSATTAGNCLVLQAASWGSGTAITAVSDPVNGAWSQAGGAPLLGNAVVQVWYKLGAAGLSTSNSLTISGGGDSTTRLSEWSGVAAASALDPATYSSTTGDGSSTATSIPTGSITTAGSGDLYLAWAAEDGGGTITWSAAAAPWTLSDNTGDTTYIAAAAHDRTDGPAAGAYSDSLAYSGTAGNGAAKIVALRASGGSGAAGDKDAGQRFRLRATAWRDAPARFSLRAAGYRHLASRFRSQAAAARDSAARFLLLAPARRDAGWRLRLLANGGWDIAVRFRLLAPAYRDVAGRLRLLAWALRDVATRAILAAGSHRDAVGRVRAAAAAFHDAGNRLLLQSATADSPGVLLASPAGTPSAPWALASPARSWVLAGQALTRLLPSSASRQLR